MLFLSESNAEDNDLRTRSKTKTKQNKIYSSSKRNSSVAVEKGPPVELTDLSAVSADGSLLCSECGKVAKDPKNLEIHKLFHH